MNLLPAHWEGGARAILISPLRGRKVWTTTKVARKGGSKKRGGNSAAPERPARAKRRRSIKVFREMGSGFFKQTPPLRLSDTSNYSLNSIVALAPRSSQ